METTEVKIKLSSDLQNKLLAVLKNFRSPNCKSFRNSVTRNEIAFQELNKMYRELTANEIHLDLKYLHEWVEASEIILPTIPTTELSPEYKERIKKLRAAQEWRDYKQMTSNVDKQTSKEVPLSFGKEIKEVQSQLFSVINFVLSIGGTFVFGYKAMEYSMPNPDFSLQLMAGLTMATIVGLAELYFLAKLI